MSLKISISTGVFGLLGLGFLLFLFAGCGHKPVASPRMEAPVVTAPAPVPEPEPESAPQPENASAPVYSHEPNVQYVEAPPEPVESPVISAGTRPSTTRPPAAPQSNTQSLPTAPNGSSWPASSTVVSQPPPPVAPIPVPIEPEVVPALPSKATFGVACPDTMRYGVENAVVATFQVDISNDSTEAFVTTLLRNETLSKAVVASSTQVDVVTIDDLRGIVSIEANLMTSSEDKFKWAEPLASRVPLSEAPMDWTWQVIPQERNFAGVLQVGLIGHYENGTSRPLFGGSSGRGYPVQVISTKEDWVASIFSEVSGEWKWVLMVFVFPLFKWGYAKWKAMHEKKPEVA